MLNYYLREFLHEGCEWPTLRARLMRKYGRRVSDKVLRRAIRFVFRPRTPAHRF